MRIIVINKDRLEKIPPLISVINILSDLGHNVKLITGGLTLDAKERFEHRGIACEVLNYAAATNPLKKIWQYIGFRRSVEKKLRTLDFDLLWIEGGNTIRALDKSLKGLPYVLQISEMYENHKPILRSINRIIRQAQAVMIPEYNRAIIYKAWFKLDKTPYVLPNKPEAFPTEDECKRVLYKYNDVISRLENKRVLLYQGGISRVRMLDIIARALKSCGEHYHLLLIGPEQGDGVIEEIRAANPNVTHIGFIPAPDYLAFCRIAHVGIVCYQPISLNNIFCAPNKICEYSAFGLPMLANDIPGLRFTIAQNGAGVIIDPSSEASIAAGLQDIDAHYEQYRANALAYYKSVRNEDTIRFALEQIDKK